MAICTKIRRKLKKVCIGQMNRRFVVNLRQIQPPTSDSVDFSELFTPQKTVWGMLETIEGLTIFDDTEIEQVVTHNVYIRYIAGTTPEKWLKLLSVNDTPDVYLNVLKVENFGENNEFFRMRCNLRGRDDLPTNYA
jgi:hypothetical protein